MESQIANTLLSEHIIKALCNTLLHSLWQGVLLAVLSGLIIMFTKKASAAARYNLLVAAMVLFVCGTVLTFAFQVQQSQVYITSRHTVQQAFPTPVVLQSPITSNPGSRSFTGVVTGYFNTHANIIVLVWFLIICAKSIQMASGLQSIYHLKRSKVKLVNSYWEDRITQLANLLGIKQTIKLMESGIAKVPMVIGHLKPVILIPVGLINSLSADEVEAILIHELAHIRRRDYLVNLLQSFMEIVFFFNPAVLWISKLIKAERENCCDDIAVTQTNSKVNYISALVSCQEYQLNVPAYSMALADNKNSLVNRVRRIINNRNQSLNVVEKSLLAICLVATTLCLSAYSAREQIKHTIHSVVSVIHHVEQNKIEQQKLIEQTELLKKQDTGIRQNTMKVSVKPKVVKPDTTKPAFHIKVEITPVPPQTPQRLAIVGKLSGKFGTDTINIPLKFDFQVAPKIDIQPVPRVSVDISPKLILQLAPKITIDTTMKVSVNIIPKLDIRLVPQINVQPTPKVAPVPQINVNVVPKLSGNGRIPPKISVKPNPSDDEIINLLINEHIIKSKNNLDFKITNDEFIVNGIKQPKELQQKALSIFRSKSTVSSGGTISYSYSNHIN